MRGYHRKPVKLQFGTNKRRLMEPPVDRVYFYNKQPGPRFLPARGPAAATADNFVLPLPRLPEVG